MIEIRKPDNPAKAFLRQYRARKIRMESLSREIEKARERALSVTVRPKEINVQGSHAAFDSMAEAVCKAADASETLYAEYQECNRVLAQIMAAISAVPDEMHLLLFFCGTRPFLHAYELFFTFCILF